MVWAFLPIKAAMAIDNIKVYAAASMTNVITELATDYSKRSGMKVVTVFAGSSSLARQIHNGAPADIYISANKKWVDYLVENKVFDKSNVKEIAHNELVLVSPIESPPEPFDIKSVVAWESVLDSDRIALGQTESVPAGIYAKQSFINLGVWEAVQNKTAPMNSVRSALALVERAEAGLGVVYKTDALSNDKVSIITTFSNALHDPIIYPMAIVNSAASVEDFAQFLMSEESQQVFKRYGFK